jgi:hypothetical protein
MHLTRQINEHSQRENRRLAEGFTCPGSGGKLALGPIISRDLGWVELCTVLAIALIAGIRFGSPGGGFGALRAPAGLRTRRTGGHVRPARRVPRVG